MALELLQYQAGQTPLDADEFGQLIPKHLTTQGQLNEWEQTNILEARKWLRKRRHPSVLTEQFCRALHKAMFNKTWKWAGAFRRSDKNIGCDWRQVPVRLRQMFGDVQYWIEHKTYPPDEIAVRFHRNLVWIHAFPNGNGRHSRLMTDVLLDELKVAPFTWGNGADLAAGVDARAAYLAALRAADGGDYVGLMAFVRS